jgi:hypothetical protein
LYSVVVQGHFSNPPNAPAGAVSSLSRGGRPGDPMGAWYLMADWDPRGRRRQPAASPSDSAKFLVGGPPLAPAPSTASPCVTSGLWGRGMLHKASGERRRPPTRSASRPAIGGLSAVLTRGRRRSTASVAASTTHPGHDDAGRLGGEQRRTLEGLASTAGGSARLALCANLRSVGTCRPARRVLVDRARRRPTSDKGAAARGENLNQIDGILCSSVVSNPRRKETTRRRRYADRGGSATASSRSRPSGVTNRWLGSR